MPSKIEKQSDASSAVPEEKVSEQKNVAPPDPTPIKEEPSETTADEPTKQRSKRAASEAQKEALRRGRERYKQMMEEKRSMNSDDKKRKRYADIDERKELTRVRREEKEKIRREMKERMEREEEQRKLHESEKRRRQEMADRKRAVREEVRRTYRPLSPVKKPKYMEPQVDDYSSDSETLGSEDTESDGSDEISVEYSPLPHKKSLKRPSYQSPRPVQSDTFKFLD